MKKLLVVTMLGLICVGACKAAEEPRQSLDETEAFNFILPAFAPANVLLNQAFPHSMIGGRSLFAQDAGLNVAINVLLRLVRMQVAPRTMLQYAQQEGLAKLTEVFNRNTQAAIDYGLAEEAEENARFDDEIVPRSRLHFDHILGVKRTIEPHLVK